jgi:hypothetical protein
MFNQPKIDRMVLNKSALARVSSGIEIQFGWSKAQCTATSSSGASKMPPVSLHWNVHAERQYRFSAHHPPARRVWMLLFLQRQGVADDCGNTRGSVA